MTIDQLIVILENSNASAKNKALVFLIIFGIIALIGLLVLIFGPNHRNTLPIGIFLFSAGSYIAFTSILSITSKKTAYAKKILMENPAELVWVYRLNHRVNFEFKSSYLMLNFRNGNIIEIRGEDAYYNFPAIIQCLCSLNPKVHVGYSEELKRMYKQKKL